MVMAEELGVIISTNAPAYSEGRAQWGEEFRRVSRQMKKGDHRTYSFLGPCPNCICPALLFELHTHNHLLLLDYYYYSTTTQSPLDAVRLCLSMIQQMINTAKASQTKTKAINTKAMNLSEILKGSGR